MRILFFLLFLCISCVHLVGQKPAIDTSILGKWPQAYVGKLSNDGKYVAYSIKGPQGEREVFTSVYSGWKKEISRIPDADFLLNNKEAVFRTMSDSLFLIQLGTDQKKYIGRAFYYTLLKDRKNHEWLVYQEVGGDEKFVILQTGTNKLQFEKNVIGYLFNEVSGVLLLQKKMDSVSDQQQSLNTLDLLSGARKSIWKGFRARNFTFDEKGNQIAFATDEQLWHAIWYYRAGMKGAEKWVSAVTPGVDTSLLSNILPLVFSRDGKTLFFQLMEKPAKKIDPEAVKVDVWSYNDLHLQEDQLAHLAPRGYLAALNLEARRIKRLEMENESICSSMSLKDCSQYIIVTRNGGNNDLWWLPAARSSVYLESVQNDSRILLKENIPYAHDWFQSLEFSLSPDEKYVVYYDPFEDNYFSYNTDSKIIHNITRKIDARWRNYGTLWAKPQFSSPEGIAGWLEKDTAILIYDAFDIWKVDPSGVKDPVNVTNGYGTAHHIRFRLMGDSYYRKPLAGDRHLLLSAFDTANKYSGFYSKSLAKRGDPIELSMGPYVHGEPMKSENSDVWIVLRQSAKEAPNFYLTRDFRGFVPISDVQPQHAYNWLTSELVRWILPDGSPAQGILYKPEDFDPKRKYPLLIHYYEENSHQLYEFKRPEVIRDFINVPYFVSRGYLIFIPDIQYELGVPGESVVNTVLSGARYLCQNPWVDSSHMGLQGHSFGGWETNYLVTHTTLFAAAAEGAGSSDLVSEYGGLFVGLSSNQSYYEILQGRIRSSLWQRPDLYIDASPIFRADQVTTPLLMMHNKRDGLVPWSQGVEFFTALRRLGKKVWMLQYDNCNHVVANEKDAMDYTIRMTQFFDHYLKGEPAPRWMTNGVPARVKGIDTGY